MTNRLLLGAALALLSACEHGIDMKGTVVAPPEVQQLFSTSAPGQLFVIAKLPPSSSELRDDGSVFCLPAATERRIPVNGLQLACATAGEVQVSAFAVPRTTDQIDCSGAGRVRAPSVAFSPDSFDPSDALASASGTATVRLDGGGSCRDGSFDFTLTLIPKANP